MDEKSDRWRYGDRALEELAARNRRDLEEQGFTEINTVSRSIRVVDNLISAVNWKYATSFMPVTAAIARPTKLNGDEVYPFFVEDCEVTYRPYYEDGILQYSAEFVGRWFLPIWMTDIAELVMADGIYNDPTLWTRAVDAFYKGLQGDVDAANAFIGGEILVMEARKAEVQDPQLMRISAILKQGQAPSRGRV